MQNNFAFFSQTENTNFDSKLAIFYRFFCHFVHDFCIFTFSTASKSSFFKEPGHTGPKNFKKNNAFTQFLTLFTQLLRKPDAVLTQTSLFWTLNIFLRHFSAQFDTCATYKYVVQGGNEDKNTCRPGQSQNYDQF